MLLRSLSATKSSNSGHRIKQNQLSGEITAWQTISRSMPWTEPKLCRKPPGELLGLGNSDIACEMICSYCREEGTEINCLAKNGSLATRKLIIMGNHSFIGGGLRKVLF
ncbi:hypothetical protein CDAR_583781 [Caerostris darwini]|uniref:Uncharacterized protein n=1 Tax=Caerostris darwini TaxID=1538125 RepID=A0AAV4RGB2_9ARAC|nr:hypothetical protein CDAR_583781 [Caerostris darwini]